MASGGAWHSRVVGEAKGEFTCSRLVRQGKGSATDAISLQAHVCLRGDGNQAHSWPMGGV